MTTKMTAVKSMEEKVKSKINLLRKHSSSELDPCLGQAQDGLKRTGSTIRAKRSKKEEASKVVVIAEHVCFLPFDVVPHILSRLAVKSLLRFRCVCKQWCSLTYDPDFIEDQCKRALDRPALVSQISICNRVSLYHFGDDGEIKCSSLFCNKFGKVKFWRFLSNSINGLVCVSSIYSEDDGCFYLLNPSTREVAELPRSGSIDRTVNLGLGFDVSTGEYKVVRIRTGSTSESCGCEVLSVGTREWRYAGDAPCEVKSCTPLFLNGALHWIVVRYDRTPRALAMLAFDLKDEKIRVMPTPERRHYYSEWCMGLMACRGQLCFVQHAQPFYKDPGHFFRIWMLRDYTSHQWVKEYDVNISKFAAIFYKLFIIAIRGHKIIFGATCTDKAILQKLSPREAAAQATVIYSYDIFCGTSRELYRGSKQSFGLFSESLVSPRNLVGNLPL